MSKGRAFFVVGHKNWGKSRTINSLKGGARHVRGIDLGGYRFFVWSMSNDEVVKSDPQKWDRRLASLDSGSKPFVILTLCPTIASHSTLTAFQDKYDLFFWITRCAYLGHRKITPVEEQRLRTFRTVAVCETKEEDTQRANLFRNFILANMP